MKSNVTIDSVLYFLKTQSLKYMDSSQKYTNLLKRIAKNCRKRRSLNLTKSGNTKNFACKNHSFNYDANEELELFHVPNRNTLEEILLKEAEKLCLETSFLNRVVYDQEATSPFHSVGIGLIFRE